MLELLASVDTSGVPDWTGKVGDHDLNGDGLITVEDCPYPHGSPKAKLWWDQVVEPSTRADIPPEVKAKYGDACKGIYKGKPLVPGVAGKGQGDFAYLVDKLRITKGVDLSTATKIAGKIKYKMYGVS